MIINGEYVLREIGGEFVLVPVGSSAIDRNGLFFFNEVGVAIWKKIEEGLEEPEILQVIISDFEVEESVAREDLRVFIDKLMELDIVKR